MNTNRIRSFWFKAGYGIGRLRGWNKGFNTGRDEVIDDIGQIHRSGVKEGYKIGYRVAIKRKRHSL